MKTILNRPVNDITAMPNLTQAYKQVRRNKGAAGVDGMKYFEMPPCPGQYWEDVAESIRNRTYQPYPALRVWIPKEDGTQRGLNIPAVRDRVVQASIANYITFMMDEDMSDFSYGFRPERCCEQAIAKAQSYLNEGYEWVVDLDLSKFFDRVDQDRMVRIIDDLFHDSCLTSLIRKFLRAGVMVDGELVKTEVGIPQGGPLSPVLANLFLDQADKELERRGIHFARYADDMVLMVKSDKAAHRVMESFSRYLEKELKLQVNREKTKVVRPDEIKFLGYSFKKREGKWVPTPHPKSLKKIKEKLKELTSRNQSISLDTRVKKLNEVIRGWCNYFSSAWIPKKELSKLGRQVRMRLRIIIWKQWKRISKREWGLIKLGCPKEKAHSLACARQGYARCARTFLNRYITNNSLKRKGLIFIEEYHPSQNAWFHREFMRTAPYRTVCGVV